MVLAPSHGGLLPYWLLVTSAASLFNTIGCYTTPRIALTTYEGRLAESQVTAFGARMFGTWTALSCVMRLVAAYNITEPSVYYLALCTYFVALSHFASEWLVFGTMKAGRGIAPVLIVPTFSIMWMTTQRNFYLAA
ncbi:hypothetical protein G7Y89_g9157 [Cudoniella acicularis]|uniref:Ergosterol biosynthetic protein 28 n=1 Tax=Cudoniella acicularis TaxID=354080 RepID=A0A8H4W0B2_9HELO|nr:hypothetical protein G7Y89_g9157 [Cudoniella acicularis]